MTFDFCPKAVIFDMDGLLVDSEPVWAIAESAMMADRGRQVDDEIQKSLIGLRMRDFLSEMRLAYELADEVDDLYFDIVNRMVTLIPDKVFPRPGAPELLAYLHERQVPCAIASSSPMPIIEGVVAAQGWGNYFAARVSGDDVTHGKPAPDIYIEAARRLGVKPSDCLALEDSPTGARAAVAAGMVCCAVPDLSHTTHAAFDAVTPYVFDSLHDVLNVLEMCTFG